MGVMRQDRVSMGAYGVFPGRAYEFGVGRTGWYSRNGSERIEGEIIHEFAHRGMVFFVLEARDGHLDVREEFLVAHQRDAPIGFGAASDDLDAEIGEVLFDEP